jgi:hypothetical protein
MHARAAALIAALTLAPAGELAAQNAPTLDAWGAFSAPIAAPSGTVTSSYSPPLFAGRIVTSSATQTLTLDGGHMLGLQGGIDIFPSRHIGFQLLVDRAHVDVSGTNGPYTTSLTYISIPPPTTVPQTFTTSVSTKWPDTSGTLTEWTLGFNLVARTVSAGPVSASVSGGLAWYRISGDAQPLGYTDYRLGGHSVLFSEDLQVAFALDPTNSIGVNVGGDISIAFAGHAAVLVGYRHLGARTVDAAVRPATITTPDQVFFGTTIDQIARQMTPTARLDLTGSRIIVGLKITP